jgi:hypothetical protein
MFYEGSLQEGIATAIQQSKLVVCFVTGNSQFLLGRTNSITDKALDGESESQIWETEFLVDDAVRSPHITPVYDPRH